MLMKRSRALTLEGLDGRDLTRESFDTVLVDSVPKEVDFGHPELAFFKFDDQTMVLEAVKKDD